MNPSDTPKNVFNDREGIIRCANALAEIGEERIAALVRKIKANEDSDATPAKTDLVCRPPHGLDR